METLDRQALESGTVRDMMSIIPPFRPSTDVPVLDSMHTDGQSEKVIR